MDSQSQRGDSDDRRPAATSGRQKVSRRAVLATGAAVTATSLTGCLGGAGTATGTPTPEQPWTTEELAEFVDADAEITIYAGSGDDQQWYDLVDVMNDEFGTDISANVFASNGEDVSQRIVQERQADDDKWDVCSAASELTDRVATEGEDVAEKYFEWDLDTNFWFADEVTDERLMPFQLGAFNGGASSVMNVNATVFEEQGLSYPDSYNDLFDDAFAGVETVFPDFIVGKELGWIAKFHADERGMDPVEWFRALRDHLEFVGAGGYGPAVRSVAQGDGAIDFHNFPWFASSFIEKYDSLDGVFVDPVKEEAFGGDLQINNQAPNPWVARFFASAIFEEPVQRRMLTDVTDQVPARLDILDIESMDLDPYTERRLTTETDLVGFYETDEYTAVYQEIREAGVLDDI